MKSPQKPITNKMLKTAEPTMAPIPVLDLLTKMPISEMKTSGAELPAAMNVAPATSWSKLSFFGIQKFYKIFPEISNFFLLK